LGWKDLKVKIELYFYDVNSFSALKIPRQFLNAIDDLGYTTPTAIQEKSIPAVLSGQDVMGIAQTGTGKTVAYLLPLLRMLNYAQGADPRALILLPTRELAIQIGQAFDALTKYTDLRKAVLFGGAGAKTQIAELEKGVDVIIASPGRFLDLYLEGHITTKKIKHLVLDEAERLMDISFISQFHRILEVIPRKRQNLLFSATMSDLVKKISDDFLKFPVVIDIEPEQKTAGTVTQQYIKVPNLKTKVNLLQSLLEDEKLSKVIIFCRTKSTAANLGKYILRKYGEEEVRIIHGNKTQQTRINAMEDFKAKDIRLLITTDVAARGLDVIDVSHVINFDVPVVYEDYIHRIGRTGRAFKTGDAITFVTMSDEYHLAKIEKRIRQKIKEAPMPENVFVEETPYQEQQNMLREIDAQKRKEDPDFQGAFHEKKGRRR
jgi:ATP-dependent RNA helicase RhlE